MHVHVYIGYVESVNVYNKYIESVHVYIGYVESVHIYIGYIESVHIYNRYEDFVLNCMEYFLLHVYDIPPCKVSIYVIYTERGWYIKYIS